MKNKTKKRNVETFTKKWVARLMTASIIWVSFSYILAFLGKIDVAEELSKTVVSGIICVMLPYFAKSLFETKWEQEMEYKRDILSMNENDTIEIENIDDIPAG